MPEAAMVAKLGLQVPEGGVRCLAQKVDRSCIYLGPQGCTIYDRRHWRTKMWDERYRRLEEGEIIRETDEMQDDGGWKPTTMAGHPAPDPGYTSHRVYRRLKESE
jgi:hypothetical protein